MQFTEMEVCENPSGAVNFARNRAVLAVRGNPTAKWIARQIVEAFPSNETPEHLMRDRDAAYITSTAGFSLW